MKFTFYGHASFAIESQGKHFLFDPHISSNPLASHIDIGHIKADYILVSHGHGDHMSDLLEIAKNTGAKIICAYEIATWLQEKKGYNNVHGINLGSKQFEFGKLHFVPAGHSSVLPDGTYAGNPGGFVLNFPERKFYYSGDTCLIMDMKLIPEYCSLDFAILPIGGNFTMDVDDAVKAAGFIRCDKIIGVHYNTFESIQIDVQQAKGAFEQAGKTLLLPEIGEHINL